MNSQTQNPKMILLQKENITQMLQTRTIADIARMYGLSIKTVSLELERQIAKLKYTHHNPDRFVSTEALGNKTESYWSSEDEITYTPPTYKQLSFDEQTIFKNNS